VDGTYPKDSQDGGGTVFFNRRQIRELHHFASAGCSLAAPPAEYLPEFCTGYIPHLVDKTNGTFRFVMAKDYHAWIEGLLSHLWLGGI